VALTDGTGTVTDRIEYSPYGTISWRAGTTDTPFLYNGRYGVQTDTNGLLFMRARYYNPYLCRFLNPDPLGFTGGLNFYAYADGNPITLLDPFGLGAVGERGANYWSPVLAAWRQAYNPGPSIGPFDGLKWTDWTPQREAFATQLFHIVPPYSTALDVYQLVTGEDAFGSRPPGRDAASGSLMLQVMGAVTVAGAIGPSTASLRNPGVYEVLYEAPITGTSRSAHRASANAFLANQLRNDAQLNSMFDQQFGGNVLQYMESGRSGFLNPPGTVWHHPANNPNVMHLLRTSEHVTPSLQPVLHPGGIGGFGNFYGP
jgi:RHS repeat-associated protein